jgi:hypothetical protein
MVVMIADREFPYRGVKVMVGAEFECDDDHVALFTTIGHAHVPSGSKQVYATRDMSAQTNQRRRVKRS